MEEYISCLGGIGPGIEAQNGFTVGA